MQGLNSWARKEVNSQHSFRQTVRQKFGNTSIQRNACDNVGNDDGDDDDNDDDNDSGNDVNDDDYCDYI